MYLQIRDIVKTATKHHICNFFHRARLAQGICQIKFARSDAFISFLDEDYANRAAELDGLPFFGKPIKLARVNHVEWDQAFDEHSDNFRPQSGEYMNEEIQHNIASATHQYNDDSYAQIKTPQQDGDKYGHHDGSNSEYYQERHKSRQFVKSSNSLRYIGMSQGDKDFRSETSVGVGMGPMYLTLGDKDYRDEECNERDGVVSVNLNLGRRGLKHDDIPKQRGFDKHNTNRLGDNTFREDASYKEENMSLSNAGRYMKMSIGDRDYRCEELPVGSNLEEHKRDMIGYKNTSFGDKDYRENEIGLINFGRDVSLGDRDFRCDQMAGEGSFGDQKTVEDQHYREDERYINYSGINAIGDFDDHKAVEDQDYREDVSDHGINTVGATNDCLIDRDLRSEVDPRESVNVMLGDRDFRLTMEEDREVRNYTRSRNHSREGPSVHLVSQSSREMVQKRGNTIDFGGSMDRYKQQSQSGEYANPYNDEPGYAVLHNVGNTVTAGDLRKFLSGYAISDEGIIMRNSGPFHTAYVQFNSVRDAAKAERLGSGMMHGQRIQIDQISGRQFTHQCYAATTVSHQSEEGCIRMSPVDSKKPGQILKENLLVHLDMHVNNPRGGAVKEMQNCLMPTHQQGSSKNENPGINEAGYVGVHIFRDKVPHVIGKRDMQEQLVTAKDISELFSEYAIDEGDIIMQDTGWAHDYCAYVKFMSLQDADRAIRKFKSGMIHGQKIHTEYISPKQFEDAKQGAARKQSKTSLVSVSTVAHPDLPKCGSNQIDSQDNTSGSLAQHREPNIMRIPIPEIVFSKRYPYTSVFSPNEDNQEECYLGLWNLPSSITACGIWVWYGGSAGCTLGVTLGRVSESQSNGDKMTMAFVIFQSPIDRLKAKSIFRFSADYTADKVHDFLTSLDDTCEILISTKFRSDNLFTLDERSRIKSMKEPPAHLVPWVENTRYLAMKMLSIHVTACELWSATRTKCNCKGVMIVCAPNQKQRRWGFAAFQDTSSAISAKLHYGPTIFCTSLIKYFHKITHKSQVFISTPSGEDRLLNTAERDFLRNMQTHTPGKRKKGPKEQFKPTGKPNIAFDHQDARPVSSQQKSNKTDSPQIGPAGSAVMLPDTITDPRTSEPTGTASASMRNGTKQLLTQKLIPPPATALQNLQKESGHLQKGIITESSALKPTATIPCFWSGQLFKRPPRSQSDKQMYKKSRQAPLQERELTPVTIVQSVSAPPQSSNQMQQPKGILKKIKLNLKD